MKKLLFLLVFLIGCNSEPEMNTYLMAQHLRQNHGSTDEALKIFIEEYEEKYPTTE